MKRSRLVAAAALATALPALSSLPASASPAGAGHRPADSTEATYTVTLRNLTGGQWLTPPNFAAHTSAVDVFQRRGTASPGVRAVAENGSVPVLAAELAAAVDGAGLGVSGVGASAPIAPGAEVTFEFTTSADRLSIVSMLICTNDGFAGLDDKALPRRDGQTKTFELRGYDAGTELNTELNADIVPAPFCGGAGAGTDQSNPALAEGGTIRLHRGIAGVGDLGPAFDWDGPVAQVTVTRN